MNLRNLVGKTAIRTAEAFDPEPFQPVHFEVLKTCPGNSQKFVDTL